MTLCSTLIFNDERTIMKKLLIPKAIIIALFTLLGSLTYAGDLNLDDNGVAIRGYDPVAYFFDDKAVQGSSKYTAAYKGAIYHFASKVNRDTFKIDPKKYAPQYGGYCAFGVTKHRKFDADPEAWKIEDGKLYLNYNKKVRGIWLENLEENIESSDEIWPEIKTSSDHYLKERS